MQEGIEVIELVSSKMPNEWVNIEAKIYFHRKLIWQAMHFKKITFPIKMVFGKFWKLFPIYPFPLQYGHLAI